MMNHCDEFNVYVPVPPGAVSQLKLPLEDLSQSPSLLPRSLTGKSSFEVKFLLDETAATELEWHFLDRLMLDPHAASQQNHEYLVQTLYLDTSELDVFHRRGSHKNQKLRIRRYGNAGPLFLELKSRYGRRVEKHRIEMSEAELPLLGREVSRQDWDGNWYHGEIQRSDLRPVCGMQYQRRAYYGAVETGAVRLTFDRNVRGTVHADWSLPASERLEMVLPDLVICEMKFQETLPMMFKSAVEQFSLCTQGCSKYRRFMQRQQTSAAAGADCA